MAKLIFSGPFSLRLRSFLVINRIALGTYVRHAAGKRIAPDWDANFEIGIRFWRHQHRVAMTARNMMRGRLIYDSLRTETDDRYDVTIENCADPKGTWYRPVEQRGNRILLHFHGGGYAFHGGISKRFATMLAHRLAIPVFAPDYRLTPEHPYPAQAQDALTAWCYLSAKFDPGKIVVSGDSAGGHMALMLLQTLRAEGLQQPALCVGLSPWTDIGARGESLHTNNQFDLVQGWMAMKFGEWLDPQNRYGRAALSPCDLDYAGLAPIYIQAGGREVLRDMIVDFVEMQRAKGAEVTLDQWPDMPHDFQAYDSLKASSTEALQRLADIVQAEIAPTISDEVAVINRPQPH